MSPLGSWRDAPRLARLLGPCHRSARRPSAPRLARPSPGDFTARLVARDALGSHDFSGHVTARLVARARLASQGHLRAISPLGSWRDAPRLARPSSDDFTARL